MEQIVQYAYQRLGMLHVHAMRDIIFNLSEWGHNKNQFNLLYGTQEIKFSTCTDTLNKVIDNGAPDCIDIYIMSAGGQSIELKSSSKTKITLTFKSTAEHSNKMEGILKKIETSMNLVRLKETSSSEKNSIWSKIKAYMPAFTSITNLIGSLVKFIPFK